MGWIISFDFAVAIKTQWDQVVFVVIRWITIDVVNFNIRGASLSAKATMASAP